MEVRRFAGQQFKPHLIGAAASADYAAHPEFRPTDRRAVWPVVGKRAFRGVIGLVKLQLDHRQV